MKNKATYYEHPSRIIGIAATDEACAAYRDAGFLLILYKDAARFSRAQIKNPGLDYQWTIGGPENFVPVQEFRRAMP